MSDITDYLTPSQNQIMGLLRQVLPALGTVAVTLGWITSDQLGQITAIILQLAGLITLVISFVLSLKANTKTSIIKATAGMAETSVSGSTITINDPGLAKSAQEHALAVK